MAVAKSPLLDQPSWDYLLKFTLQHEAMVLHMYNNKRQASEQNDVSCGIGVSLTSAAKACQPKYSDLFYSGAPGQAPTPQELTADWNAAANLLRTDSNLEHTPDGRGYADVCHLRMYRDKVVDWMANTLKDNLQIEVTRHLPQAFPGFPTQAKIAVASFIYGLSLSAAPFLKIALRANDFRTAAQQCVISRWAKTKNRNHSQLFLNAASIADCLTSADPCWNRVPERWDRFEFMIYSSETVTRP
jgi:hypothetical protein